MENTIENKAKFFAQYFGQEVIGHPLNDKASVSVRGTYITKTYIKKTCLFLKPLSSITDEDAIEVLRLLGEYKPKSVNITYHSEDGKEWTRISRPYTDVNEEYYLNVLFNVTKSGLVTHHDNKRGEDYLNLYDYLRSKSYALPWMGLSVEQQIEYGWVKITTPASNAG